MRRTSGGEGCGTAQAGTATGAHAALQWTGAYTCGAATGAGRSGVVAGGAGAWSSQQWGAAAEMPVRGAQHACGSSAASAAADAHGHHAITLTASVSIATPELMARHSRMPA